jgi:hypothetical protein
MGELDDNRRADDAGRVRVAELTGHECEHGTEPLAAGDDQVAQGGSGKLVVGLDRFAEARFDLFEPGE